jgi:hypothetical protein
LTIERISEATVAGVAFSQGRGDLAFQSDALKIGFRSIGYHRMMIAIEKNADDAKGADIKAAINEAIDWVFLNTDAYVIHANIDQENAPSRVMAASIAGSKRRGEGAARFTVTVARWARARGMAATVKQLRKMKHHDKADRLEALGVPG